MSKTRNYGIVTAQGIITCPHCGASDRVLIDVWLHKVTIRSQINRPGEPPEVISKGAVKYRPRPVA